MDEPSFIERDERAAHLAQAKRRALAFLDAGRLDLTVSSLARDLNRHAGTRPLVFAVIWDGVDLACFGDSARMRRWIDGLP